MQLASDLKEFRNKWNLKSNNTFTYTSPKILKNEKVLNIPTVVLYLKPTAKACPAAGSCRSMCLNLAGNPAYLNNKLKCRSRRDLAFRTDENLFLRNLVLELFRFYSKNRSFKTLGCRLNGVSDHNWMSIPINLTFQDSHYLRTKFNINVASHINYSNIFDLIQLSYDNELKIPVREKLKFYDYSKRVDLDFNLAKKLNYHLTLSAGSLFDTLGTAIKYKLNYAGVLNVKRNAILPSHIEINGIKFPVIDGDISDWRIGDNSDTTNIVGLRVKRTPNQTEEMRKAFCIA
tara:strand:- start:1026 stop:1892 length:867 start_codon:yes stop_codon:yes gene_type:complete